MESSFYSSVTQYLLRYKLRAFIILLLFVENFKSTKIKESLQKFLPTFFWSSELLSIHFTLYCRYLMTVHDKSFSHKSADDDLMSE